jgi:DNA primase
MNVEEVLNSQGIEYTTKGADCLILCINPEHDDGSPSMRVDKVTGIFNCFSCGHKGNIFVRFGEKANQLDQRKELLKRKIYEKLAESSGLPFPESVAFYEEDWRGISPATYKKFEAFQSSEPDFIGRLVFPIRDLSGRVVAFIGRHTTQGDPRYLVTPHKVKLPVYPQPDPHRGYIMLVEGIFDAVNLWDKGFTNVGCIFGTNNINTEKLQMLKMKGASTIDIFLDGDDAGQLAAEKIKEMCEEVELRSRNIFLEGRDPGELTQAEVSKLHKKLYG